MGCMATEGDARWGMTRVVLLSAGPIKVQIEESHDRKSHDRKLRLPHKPPAHRLTMQLRNGKRKLDAYLPTFDPCRDIATVVFSHVQCVKTRASLAKVSKLWRDASKDTAAYPRFFDLEGVAGDDIADHLVRLLDDDHVRSMDKERALELIGVHKNRLCEYACVQRNFKVLKWARNELDLPWAQYPAEPVNDDILVLRMLRAMYPELQERWPEAVRPEDWEEVTIENGRVVQLVLENVGLTGALPAEIGQLTSLRLLRLGDNKLTRLPAEIGRLTLLRALGLLDNQLTSLPAEIGQLTSLKVLYLGGNQLTSLPAEVWQLTSLESLDLDDNQLTSLPAEVGQLTSLEWLGLHNNQLTSLPAEIGQLTSLEQLDLNINQLTRLPAEMWQLTSLQLLHIGGNQLTRLPAEIGQLTSLTVLYLSDNQLSSVPAEIWQLTSLRELNLRWNQLTSVSAKIGQLTSLRELSLEDNELTSVPAAIRELRAAGCDVHLDDGVTYDIRLMCARTDDGVTVDE